ncbi:hypothetical protein NZK35_22435 [Stieleria sp. ICT_E10.1]|uniref:hypothetical protein n=1 Tax=Stieleria sedimenti TaxID=2976331 RepID=UPI00218046F3|nr:hypothetical protein [Stieleria sedimenti]MCS7469420.1 hypothetical protein [Stieleria sedimenti]
MKLPTQAIPIWPRVEAELRRADTGAKLEPIRVVIPGSRVMAIGASDGQQWMVDLPVGAAIKAPATLNPATGEVIAKHAHTAWYAEQLRHAYAQRDRNTEIIPKVVVRKTCREIVIVNCIDHLYGHCLLKLLNCDYHHRRDPQTGICVLIQPQMRHLVPDYVAEIWEVPVGLSDGVGWFDSIDRWIFQRLGHYDSASVSRAYSHLSKAHYDINRFVRGRITPTAELHERSPIIHFSCRGDRCWGTDPTMQQKRLHKLYFQLRRRYQDIGFVISGFGDPVQFPSDDSWHSGWIDLRTNRLDSTTEDAWLSTMAAADVVVGVHGSNMLLPTAFAPSAVIMLPLEKYDGIGLDVLMPTTELEPREEMLNYAFVYGDDHLLDVTPKTIARMIANKLGYSRINMEWFRFGPDFNDDTRLQQLLVDSEKVGAVHRIQRNNVSGRVKDSLHRLCLRLAATFE